MYPKIIDYLNNCIKSNTLSHAYIFYGPDEVSKRKIAFWFANSILKNKDEKFPAQGEARQRWHPDIFSFKPEASSDITIGLIRQMKKFISLSPYSGTHKVVIIENAENLNDYAQNAILKTFEEAPVHAIIILCVKTLDSIRETIVSRGIKLPFWHSNEQKVVRLRSPQEEKSFSIFDKVVKSNSLELFSSFEDLHSDNKAPAIFELWIKFLRTKFIFNPDKKLFDLLKTSQGIYFKLNETNINPKLAYDELLLNLQNKS
ncbi:MAG: hypothetical protein HYW79_03680 [Parcubacteria group bacterium]|nr:hypothetical protein [Parcubacteria group bacterium]